MPELAEEIVQLNEEMADPLQYAEAEARPTLVTAFQAVPGELLLGTLGDARFRVAAPFAVRCLKQEGQIVAEVAEINEFGFGQNVSEALRDLQLAIVELYQTLEEDQHCLGPDLQDVWTTLQQKIRRRP